MKKYKINVSAKRNLVQSNREITTFDRFFVFGVPGTANTMVLFSKDSAQTKSLMRLSGHLRQGNAVWILQPSCHGTLTPQTPEIPTAEALIACKEAILPPILVMPPADVLMEKYVYFDFITRKLDATASTQDNVCACSFCDRQNGGGFRACTIAAPKKHWLVSLSLTMEELAPKTRSDVVFCSERTTRVFVDANTLMWPMSNAWIDPVHIDDAVSCRYFPSLYLKKIISFIQVEAMVANVNEEQDFRVMGGGDASDSFSFHITYLMPAAPLSDEQRGLKYRSGEDYIPS